MRNLEAGALTGLGILRTQQSDQAEALRFLEQALRIYRETGDRKNEIHLLNYVNISIWQLGDYARAWVCFEQALRLAREIG
ncbi:MAG: tetratricopeptide repeat protein, partial [Anaerolineae bacterium]|nr:tetratricopeptide repeat protein [Anaerolineae bacterium]